MIRYAQPQDIKVLTAHDRHIRPEELARSAGQKKVLVMVEEGRFAGWLRYSLFWDNTPFMNMLFMLEAYRGRGLGGQLTAFWEQEMKAQGYTQVLTSTQSNEEAQFFYRKQGYTDCGALLLPGEPLEIILRKEL